MTQNEDWRDSEHPAQMIPIVRRPAADARGAVGKPLKRLVLTPMPTQDDNEPSFDSQPTQVLPTQGILRANGRSLRTGRAHDTTAPQYVGPDSDDDISTWETVVLQAMRAPRLDPSQFDTVVMPAPHITFGGVRLDGAVWDTQRLSSLRIPTVKPHRGAATSGAVLRGVVSMVLREGVLKLVVLAANVVLARLLAPSDFGIFVVLGFFNTFLSTFGTFGLAAAIVQRQSEPSQQELGALFTIQTSLGVLLVVLMTAIAPLLAPIYHLGDSGVWLIRAAALSFLFTVVGATPLALLERRLAFSRVAIVDVLIGVIYQILSVGLAVFGFGVWSLVIGGSVSTAVGALAAFVASGWRPHISFHWKPVFAVVRFGLQYQTNNVIILLKDNIAPTFVAAYVGASGVGFITWSSTLAFYPLILMNIVARVSFPAYARLANDKVMLQRMIETNIRYQSYVIFPAVAALAALSPYITHIVFSDKWQPGVPLIYWFLVSTVTASVSTTLVSALNALGKPGVVTKLMLLWLALGWLITIPFIIWLGYLGYAVSNALIALSYLVTIRVFKRYQKVIILPNIAVPMLSTAITTAAFLAISRIAPPTTIPLLVLQGIGVLAVFVGSELVLDRKFLTDARFVLRSVFEKVHLSQTVNASA